MALTVTAVIEDMVELLNTLSVYAVWRTGVKSLGIRKVKGESMYADVYRDMETFYCVMMDIRRRKELGRKLGTRKSDHMSSFVKMIVEFLQDSGCRPTRSGGLYVPKKNRADFDGRIFVERSSDNPFIIIPVIVNDEPWIVSTHCERTRSDRGICYVCTPSDFLSSLRQFFGYGKMRGFCKEKAIVVKEHAIRRAQERSPIKDYHLALGMILWSIYKGDVDKKDETVIRETTGCRHVATCATYRSFGRVVATNVLAGEGSYCRGYTIVNTYLSEDMIV